MKIAIIGTGAYALSMAKRLAKNMENSIVLWSEDENKVKEFNKTKKIKEIFKDEVFADNINIVNDYNETIKNANIIFIMVSSKFFKNTLYSIKPFYNKNIPIVIGTKGIETDNKKFNFQLAKEILKTNNIAVIAGPSFAIDILNDEILSLTVATKKKSIYKLIKNILNNNTYLERSKDIKGVQISSIIKNVYAIGSGILSSLGLPASIKATYLTKVVNETEKILYELTDDGYSIFLLGVMGDIIMTCSDDKSRNYTYGTKLTSKSKASASNYLSKNTVEGYNSLEYIYNLIKKNHIKAPIIFTIYDIIFNNLDKQELKNLLLKK